MKPEPAIYAVCQSPKHRFSKVPQLEIRVVGGMGVEGDAHFGATTQHRYDRRYAPDRPNLRQVHLIDMAQLEGLRSIGFDVHPGDLGENISTVGIDLTALPAGTVLNIGDQASLEVTGLREPCVLLDKFQSGLRRAVEGPTIKGKLSMRGGVMSRVLRSGAIRPGDKLQIVTCPPECPSL